MYVYVRWRMYVICMYLAPLLRSTVRSTAYGLHVYHVYVINILYIYRWRVYDIYYVLIHIVCTLIAMVHTSRIHIIYIILYVRH